MLHELHLSNRADRRQLHSRWGMRLQGLLRRVGTQTIAKDAIPALPDAPAEVSEVAAAVIRELRIAEVASTLGEAGIRSVVLKGPSISRWLYGEMQARSYADSDILVAPSDISAARRVIVALGYSREDEILTGDRPWGALYWMRPHDGAALDLHRTLPGIEVSPETAWLILSAETEVLSLRGVEIEVLNQAARALHLVLHAADHGFSSNRPLKELTLAIAALPEDLWSRAASLASKLEAAAAFAAGLRLVPEGVELAARLHLPDNDSLEVALRASPATRHALGLQWLLQTKGPGAKAALLGRKLAPPPPYMRAWSRLAQKGRPGLVLAYAWRPLYLLLEAPLTIHSWWRARRELRERLPTISDNRT